MFFVNPDKCKGYVLKITEYYVVDTWNVNFIGLESQNHKAMEGVLLEETLRDHLIHPLLHLSLGQITQSSSNLTLNIFQVLPNFSAKPVPVFPNEKCLSHFQFKCTLFQF